LSVKSLEEEILRTIRYFEFFGYPPIIEEIHTFLPKKTTKEKLKKELDYLINKKTIKNLKLKIKNSYRYTVGGYGIKNIKYQISNVKYFLERQKTSQKKLNGRLFRLYIRLLSLFPQIKLIGLSGTMAMMNAKDEDDIDLFIITAQNRLFTGRFMAVILAKLLGIYRQRKNKCYMLHVSCYMNKLCLNLFFDERKLEVPDFKKTEYVAHEVLQMKPLIVREGIYHQFLAANRWVYDFYPNASRSISNIKNQKLKTHIKNQKYISYLICIFDILFLIFNIIQDWIELLIRKFQLYFIKKHQTSEIITNHQLWFHPQDFGKKAQMRG